MSKLLIVDDEVDILEFSRNFFKRRGFDIVVASDGAEALTAVSTEKPDLILLDIRMQKMSGLEVLQTLRQLNNLTKVIMVTGVEDESTMSAAWELGIVGYIHKPLILDELEKIVLKEIVNNPPT